MNNEDLQKFKAAAEGCDGWTWPDRRRDEKGTHHFGRRTEDGEFYDMGTIDAWTYTSDYADDLRVLKFIRQAQPQTILALIAEVEQARAEKQEPIGFIAPRMLESLEISREFAKIPGNHSVAIQAGKRSPEDIPVFVAPQVPPAASNSWQPIETAPQDGIVVLTARQVRYGKGYVIEGMVKNSAGWWVTVDGDRPSQPTYWQPLPDVPK